MAKITNSGNTPSHLALARQKDLYAMLSQTNQAIVRVPSRDELLAAVCRIAVEHGHFLFAWIGLIDETDSRVQPVAKYGEDAGYLEQVRVLADPSDPAGRGPTGQALRSGTRVVTNDFLDDPATAPWHEVARRAGVRAKSAFPLRLNRVVVGTLNLYAGEPGFFTEDLLPTLDSMAEDVSFALDNFAREAERTQAVGALRESEQKLRTIFEGAIDGVLVADGDTGKFMSGNPAICRQLGYTLEELLRLSVSDIHRKQDLPHVKEDFEMRRKGTGGFSTEISVLRKDGSVFFADIQTAPIRLFGKNCLLGIFRDVTERIRSKQQLVEAEAQFRDLIEQSIAGILIIQNGKLVYVNPRCAEIVDQGSVNELIGTDPLQWVAEADRGLVAECIRRLLAGEARSVALDFGVLRRDGVVIHVGANASRGIHAGQPAIIGLVQDISEKKRAEETIQRYVAQIKNAFMSTVEVATIISEMRDPYTAGHERRVAEIAVAIGAELGLDEQQQEGLRVAGYLHDVGKITIPSEILAKPGKLSPIEFSLIQGHARASYDVLKGVEFPWPVAQVALQHHERIDGSGYPQGLQGDAILLEARIIAVADVVEAMSSHRPYRPGFGIEVALTEIERGCGTTYDSAVADACVKLFREKGYAIPA